MFIYQRVLVGDACCKMRLNIVGPRSNVFARKEKTLVRPIIPLFRHRHLLGCVKELNSYLGCLLIHTVNPITFICQIFGHLRLKWRFAEIGVPQDSSSMLFSDVP